MNGTASGDQSPRRGQKNIAERETGNAAPQRRQDTAGKGLIAPSMLGTAAISGTSSEASYPGSDDTDPSMTTTRSTESKPVDPGQTERAPPGPELSRIEPTKSESVAEPEPETTMTMVVHASTGPVFDISVTKPIFVHSISFEKTCKVPSPMKVKSKSLKKKLFQKLFEKTSFKAEFPYDKDEVFFDGHDKLFSLKPSSLKLNEYRVLGFGFTQPTVTYQVHIKFVAEITPEASAPKSDDDWENIGAIANLACNGLEITSQGSVDSASQSGETDSRSLSYTDRAIATMRNTKTSQQLAVMAIPRVSLQKVNLLDLIKDPNGDIPPVALLPDWLIRNLVGLQVTCRNEDHKIDMTKYRIVGIGKPAKNDDGNGFGKLALPNLPLVNIRSSRHPAWVPIEKLQAVDEQQLFRRFPTSVKKSLLNSSQGGHDDIKTSVQGYLEPLGLSAKVCPLIAKQFTAVPLPIYCQLPQRSRGPAPRTTTKRSGRQFAATVATDAKGQWKLRNGEGKRTLVEICAVHIQRVLELGSGCAMGSPKALKYSLEKYKERIDGWSGINPEPNRTPIYQADVNKLHSSESVKNMFLDYTTAPLVVLLPSSSPLQFSKVKLWADCLRGIHTVCALRKRGAVCLPHVEELAMKINHHSGGTNYEVWDLGLTSKDTMVLGISVSHPAPALTSGHIDCPSVVAVVANSDNRFQKLPGNMRFQPNGSKKIIDLKEMVRDSVKRWQNGEQHGDLGEIIVYRTGISKIDYTKKNTKTGKRFWEEELSDIEAACALDLTVPSIALILVEKNHKTKFYRPKDADLSPGLFVEGGDKSGDNFYLQSHGVMQPKTRDARAFNINVGNGPRDRDTQAMPRQEATQGPDVLHPRNGFYSIFKPSDKRTNQQLIKTTYKLCWNTVHSTSALSYASPAYYADKLCQRGLAYLKPVIDRKMSFAELNRTYFNLSDGKKNPWHNKLDGQMFYI
ncbi:hypothetical protein EG328_004824 [Venturia inaequalis]|uniref:Piwi domain-containing protein n=1 Tax=Venturia inaequalis TaxID=5025 RepID=A0A8H3YWW8_VENIN|nr:hypothetical protein EG328_004824 [Venturia inaequalis]